MPHLALPLLTSALRNQGIDVIQRDLNLETYEMVLSRAYLEEALERIQARSRSGRGPGGQGLERIGSERLRWAWEAGPRLAAQVEGAVAAFRSKPYYDGERSLAAFTVIAQALELASLPYFPARFDLLSYEPALPVDSSRDLLKAARDPARNMLTELFRRLILPDIIREQPDIVGISIPTRGQMLAAVTLAYLIKQAGLDCHITVGGPHITMLREQLPQAPALFDVFDSAVLFAGEAPLLRLAETLDAGGDLAQVPSLVWRDEGRVRVGSPDDEVNTSYPGGLPDFDGLPLDRYLAPDLVLPLITAHGCYHGRCAFCNAAALGSETGQGFHALPVERVLEQIDVLRAKYDVRHIFFADEAIPPRTLRELSSALAKQGAPVSWCGCARFDRALLERALTEPLLKSMAAGGCRMLLFGLETGSERMIRHMVKGTQAETMSRVLRTSAAAGIWNHTFFFFGFPTETMEDAQATVNFLYAHQDALHSASPGVFILERFSPVHVDPARFGVKRVIDAPDQDLAIYFDYVPETGLDEDMAGVIVERLLSVLPAKRYGQYYLHDVNRFLYASHLHAQGQSFPLWLADERAGAA